MIKFSIKTLMAMAISASFLSVPAALACSEGNTARLDAIPKDNLRQVATVEPKKEEKTKSTGRDVVPAQVEAE